MPLSETQFNQAADALGPYLEQKLLGNSPKVDCVVPYASRKREIHEPAAIRSVEVLGRLRMRHVCAGDIPAFEMLRIADSIQMTHELNYVVLMRGAEELQHRAGRLGRTDPTRMSVNISASQMRRPDFQPTILSALEQHNFPLSRVSLEILETEQLVLSTLLGIKMQLLMILGINFEIDDLPDEFSEANVDALHALQMTIQRAMGTEADHYFNGMKFGKPTRDALCDQDHAHHRRTMEDVRAYLDLYPSISRAVTFERAGDTPEEREQTRQAILRAIPLDLRKGRIIQMQGDVPVPIDELPGA